MLNNKTNFAESEGTKTKEIQKRIIGYRKKLGLTQDDVADKLNMKRSSYAYNESRAIKLSFDFVDKVAAAIGIPSHYLWWGEPKNTFHKLNEPPPTPVEVFMIKGREQKMLEMLRCLPKETSEQIFKYIKDAYDNQKLKNINNKSTDK